jgi:integrase
VGRHRLVSAPDLRAAWSGPVGEGDTKTEGSVREIHMLPRVRRALKAQRAATDGRSVWVFPNDRGGALNITNLRERV